MTKRITEEQKKMAKKACRLRNKQIKSLQKVGQAFSNLGISVVQAKTALLNLGIILYTCRVVGMRARRNTNKRMKED